MNNEHPDKASKRHIYHEVKTKAMAYCAYQERSLQQMRDKLYEYGLEPDEIEAMTGELISENFLDEKRFAKAYAGGKFRMKKWGRLKIRQGLKQHRVKDEFLSAAMKEIDPEEYYETLKELIEKKNSSLTEKDPLTRKSKLLRYAASKGYEQDLIWEAINEILEK